MEIPFYEIEFNKDARLVDPWQVLKLKKALAAQQVTDLIVLSHGWNNDMNEARSLYKDLLHHISTALSAELKSTPRRFIALNVLWPSKKFADKDLIAGGAAFITDDAERLTLIEEWIKMAPLLNDGGTQATYKSILDDLSRNADKKRLIVHFSKLMKQLSLSQNDAENKLTKNIEEEDVELLLEDGKLSYIEPEGSYGGAAGIPSASAAEGAHFNSGGAQSLSGILDGIRNLMNLTTYYKMKDLAGKIGKQALHPLLKDLLAVSGNEQIRLHLIGHSFGARLVTAAVLGNDDQSLQVQSLTLLQAAFSHYSFAENYQPNTNGAFRNIILHKLVKGAFLITHTRADKAVSIAYAIASRIAGQVASAIGDENSLYGGLGGNGAQKTPEVKKLTLHNGSNPYGLLGGQVYNVQANGIITDHSDILKPAVGSIIVEAFFAD